MQYVLSKCFPINYLLFFVYLHGQSYSGIVLLYIYKETKQDIIYASFKW